MDGMYGFEIELGDNGLDVYDEAYDGASDAIRDFEVTDSAYDFNDTSGIGDLGITGFGTAMHLGEEVSLEEDLMLESMSEIDLEHMLDEAPVEMISVLTKKEAETDQFMAAVKENLGYPGEPEKEIKLGQTWQDIF